MKFLDRIFKNNVPKKRKKKIQLLVNQIIDEFSLDGIVEVVYTDSLPMRQGRFDRFKSLVIIGIKETLDTSKTITDEDWLAFKNTIHHELTHAKNYISLDHSTKEKINNQLYSLKHFAYKLIDEYSAYSSADGKYRQTGIGSSEETIQRALRPLWSNDYFVEQTTSQNGFNDAMRYEHFVDLCTAVLVHSIRNDKFPSFKETYTGYNEMCKSLVSILEKYSAQLPLNHEEYEKASLRIWEALLIMVPENKVALFKRNVGIIF
ncbi:MULTISPECIES: hypothetical protein [unclassified Paenibacillus]|uniref:hypothetical protein n=1 Tax=unclassified Paenibacillus TaxID=185978 RepID=UPI0009A6A654|nr:MULTISPECIES: hypothetical protein [unclassified Paenibacillus]SLK16420.1 hypothetical protein SAMN06272722_110158 [Paenibacillus sp. RU5A]SOC74372.1 hypothetical protein SAMN05880581_110158 [Paenibacillus sp. RU26A]SOC76492.1 hypothetical protein SAMN05880586_110158 [Paenibacillus sp. RU5M]